MTEEKEIVQSNEDVSEEVIEKEFFSVSLRDQDGELTVNVHPGVDIEKILPLNFIEYVCVNVGTFVKNSMNQLKVVEKKEDKQ